MLVSYSTLQKEGVMNPAGPSGNTAKGLGQEPYWPFCNWVARSCLPALFRQLKIRLVRQLCNQRHLRRRHVDIHCYITTAFWLQKLWGFVAVYLSGWTSNTWRLVFGWRHTRLPLLHTVFWCNDSDEDVWHERSLRMSILSAYFVPRSNIDRHQLAPTSCGLRRLNWKRSFKEQFYGSLTLSVDVNNHGFLRLSELQKRRKIVIF